MWQRLKSKANDLYETLLKPDFVSRQRHDAARRAVREERIRIILQYKQRNHKQGETMYNETNANIIISTTDSTFAKKIKQAIIDANQKHRQGRSFFNMQAGYDAWGEILTHFTKVAQAHSAGKSPLDIDLYVLLLKTLNASHGYAWYQYKDTEFLKQLNAIEQLISNGQCPMVLPTNLTYQQLRVKNQRLQSENEKLYDLYSSAEQRKKLALKKQEQKLTQNFNETLAASQNLYGEEYKKQVGKAIELEERNQMLNTINNQQANKVEQLENENSEVKAIIKVIENKNDELKATIARIEQNNQDLKKESERISKESERISKESERISKESERISKESERISKESERIIKESERISEENERIIKENERISKDNAKMKKNDVLLNQRLDKLEKVLEALSKEKQAKIESPSATPGTLYYNKAEKTAEQQPQTKAEVIPLNIGGRLESCSFKN